MKPEQLLKISALAGKILLENGAEIQRTEDTICRICEAYGVEEASAFVIPTGMFLSIWSASTESMTSHGAVSDSRCPARRSWQS